VRSVARYLPSLVLAACVATIPGVGRAEEPLRVFAAASLTSVLNEIAAHWQAEGHPKPRLAYGGTATLAKQIEAGAPVDVFASADAGWMDYLDERRLIDRDSRVDLLGNELVLIAPRGKGFRAHVVRGFDLAGAFRGKLCTGEPGVVPVGTYARQALESLGWWGSMQARIVGTDDVRTALAFVERGECGAGIVYATDAAISDEVEVVARFPADSHSPIVYPFALVKGGRAGARAFLEYLRSAPVAAESFERHGFVLLKSRT
jgi:molybdate transport system substrate-binding protein